MKEEYLKSIVIRDHESFKLAKRGTLVWVLVELRFRGGIYHKYRRCVVSGIGGAGNLNVTSLSIDHRWAICVTPKEVTFDDKWAKHYNERVDNLLRKKTKI